VSPPPTSRDTSVEQVRPREVWLAAAACLAVAGLHLAVAARFGSLGVARNDDWTYSRVAFAVDAGGTFAPDPYTRTMLVGLIVLARPVMAVFGPSMVALQVMVALVGAVGLWAAWLLARSILDRGAASVAVAALALGPLWGAMSTTFMSDVPAFTVQALALVCAALALRNAEIRWGWLAASLALCLAAFTIREYAIAATVAVLVATLARSPRRSTALRLAAAGLLWLVAALALITWRSHQAVGAAPWTPQLPGPDELKGLVRTVYTVALLLSPAVVLVLVRTRAAFVRRHWVCAAVTFVVLLVGVITPAGSVLLGNYVTRSGSYSETVSGPQPIVVVGAVWWLIVAVAVVSATVLVTLGWSVLRRARRRPGAGAALMPRLRAAEPALVLAIAFTAAVVVVVLTIGFVMHNRIFDRYLMPMTPYAAAVILWTVKRPGGVAADEELAGAGVRGSRVARTAGAVGLVVLATLGTAFVAGSASFDGAKWRLGERAVAAGYAAETVDGGLEWFGLHQPAPVVMKVQTLIGDSWWVTGLFTDPRVCALATYLPDGVSGEPVPGPDDMPGEGPVLAREQVWAPLGPPFELALRRSDATCSKA
jgi:hypothetical protein